MQIGRRVRLFPIAIVLLAVSASVAGGNFLKGNPIKTLASAPGSIVDHVFFRSTVNSFENAANDAASNAMRQLDAVLQARMKSADVLLQKRLEDLSQITQEATENLRQEGDRFLQKLEAQTDESIVQLRDASKEFVVVAGLSLRRTVVVGITLALVVVAIAFMLAALLVRAPAVRRRVLVTSGGIAVTALVGMGIYLRVDDTCGAIRPLIARAEAGYRETYRDYQFARARTYAAVLDSLGSECRARQPITPSMLVRKTELIAEILFNPWSYKENSRLDAMKAKLAQLQKEFEAAVSFPDNDLQTLQAMIYWVTSINREGELVAAEFAADSLDNATNAMVEPGMSTAEGGIERSKWQDTYPLLPLAQQVLANYLTHPMTVDEIDVVGRFPSDPDERAEAIRRMQDWPRAEESARTLVRDYPPSPSSSTLGLEPFSLYGQYARELQRTTIPAYVCMVHYSSLIGADVDTAQSRHTWRTERQKCIDRILAAYNGTKEQPERGFVGRLRAADFDGTSIRIAALAGPHAVVGRARSASETTPTAIFEPPTLPPCRGDKGLVRAICEASRKKAQKINVQKHNDTFLTIVPPLPEGANFDKSPPRELLQRVLESLPGPYTQNALQAQLRDQYVADSQALADFELKYVRYMQAFATYTNDKSAAAEKSLQEAQSAAALAGGKLGLFVCHVRDIGCASYWSEVDDPFGVLPITTFMENRARQSFADSPLKMDGHPGLLEGAMLRRRWIL